MMRRLTLLAAALLLPSPAFAADYAGIDDLAFGEPSQAGQQLVEYLDSSDPQERWRAARALGALGYQPAAAELAGLLADPDPVVQVHAMIAVTRIGDVSPAVLDAIMANVASADERVARTALQTLQKLKPGPEKLAAALESVLASDDQAVMTHVVDALVEAGPRATPLLNKALENEKSAYWAAVAIQAIGPDASGAAAGLTKVVQQSQDADTVQQALLALAALGADAHASTPAVQELAAKTESDALRIAACYTLGMLGDASSTGLLRELSSAGGEFQLLVATWSIAMLHPDDPAAESQAIALLTKALKSDRPEVREAAATGLSRLDAPAEKVAPALLAALSGASPAEQSNIAAALASLGPQVVDRAIAGLDKPEFTDIAVEVLGRLGAEAAPAADALASHLGDAEPARRARINFALGAIGPQASSAAGKIAEGLSSSDAAVRQSALFALRQIGPGPAAAQVSEFMTGASDGFEQLAAAWVLSATQPSGDRLAAVAKTLESGLKHDEPRARLETIDAIAALGPAGAVLKPALNKAAEGDANADVREAAAQVAAGL